MVAKSIHHELFLEMVKDTCDEHSEIPDLVARHEILESACKDLMVTQQASSSQSEEIRDDGDARHGQLERLVAVRTGRCDAGTRGIEAGRGGGDAGRLRGFLTLGSDVDVGGEPPSAVLHADERSRRIGNPRYGGFFEACVHSASGVASTAVHGPLHLEGDWCTFESSPGVQSHPQLARCELRCRGVVPRTRRSTWSSALTVSLCEAVFSCPRPRGTCVPTPSSRPSLQGSECPRRAHQHWRGDDGHQHGRACDALGRDNMEPEAKRAKTAHVPNPPSQVSTGLAS